MKSLSDCVWRAKRVMWGHRVLLRLNDNFIIQSIPVGDDSLNRAWWFIMGVITQSFSPKSTTWLPTQHTETHVHWQILKDKERTIETVRCCHIEKNTHRRWRLTSGHNTYIETEQTQRYPQWNKKNRLTQVNTPNKIKMKMQTQEENEEVIEGWDILCSCQPIPGTISWS